MRTLRTIVPVVLTLLVAAAAADAQKAGKRRSAGGRTLPKTARAASFAVW